MRVWTTLNHPLFVDREKHERQNRELAEKRYAEIVAKIRDREAGLSTLRSWKWIHALGSLCRGVFKHHKRFHDTYDQDIHDLAYRVASAVQMRMIAYSKELDQRKLDRAAKPVVRRKGVKRYKTSEKARFYSRKYHQDHREEINAKQREKYWANPEKTKIASRKAYQDHQDQRKASSRKYQQDHREEINAKQREKYWANPEKARARARKYRTKNSEKKKASSRKYRQNHRDELTAKERERYAKKKALAESAPSRAIPPQTNAPG